MSERIHCLMCSIVQKFVSVSFYEGISLCVVAVTARLHGGHVVDYQRYSLSPSEGNTSNILLLLLLLLTYLLTYLFTTIEFSLGGSSPYTRQKKKNKYT
jgi:hypothetical protein